MMLNRLQKAIVASLVCVIIVRHTYFVHMMEDSLMSSDQIRAVQSATVRKFLGKNGFLCRAYIGP